MPNLADNEICPVNKSEIINKCKFFLAKKAEHEKVSADKYENANNCWHLHVY